MTTLRSDICRRNAVCRLFVVRRLSIMFVHPTQPVELFRNVSTPFCTLAIRWPHMQNVTEIFTGNPSVGG